MWNGGNFLTVTSLELKLNRESLPLRRSGSTNIVKSPLTCVVVVAGVLVVVVLGPKTATHS